MKQDRMTSAERIEAVTKEAFLTARWNNVLTLGMGLVFVIYAILASSVLELSDSAAFVGLVAVGVIY